MPEIDHIHVSWLSTHGLNCENFDKLSRLKFLQLQTNKYLSQFLKWLVSMFLVIDSLICEYTDPMNIMSCVKVASNFLFILSVRHIGRMNMQVWLLNSLVRLAGWANTEQMMFNSVHNVEMLSEMPSEMSYLLVLLSWNFRKCVFTALIHSVITSQPFCFLAARSFVIYPFAKCHWWK